MTVLYVREQGAVVGRELEQIKVTLPEKAQLAKQNKAKRQETRPQRPQEQGEQPTGSPQQEQSTQRAAKLLKRVSVRELEQVVLYGNVQLTSQAADLLLDHDIDVVFLSYFGKYRGRLGKDGSKFAKLRHAQLLMSNNQQRTLAVAKAIVQTKLTNQRNLLQQLAEHKGKAHAAKLTQAMRAIEQLRKDSKRARNDDVLRGYEGKAAVHYFDCFKLLLAPAWDFKGRAYHPAPDPFNALLSFGYSLLLKDLYAVAQLVGLDPYIGCFHALEYGRPSLVLDLMEEFRPLVVDRPFLDFVLRGQLQPADFVFTDRQERPVEIGEKNLPLVIQVYEQRLGQTVQHTASRTQQTVRRCFELQARIYARVIMETRADYEGLMG